MPRRMSHALAGAVAAAAAEGMEDEDDGYEGTSTSRRPHSDKEEFFDVTIVRDMVRGTPPRHPPRPA